MTPPFDPAMLEGAYEFLRATPPFRRWKLPPGEAIEFHVIASPGLCGLGLLLLALNLILNLAVDAVVAARLLDSPMANKVSRSGSAIFSVLRTVDDGL